MNLRFQKLIRTMKLVKFNISGDLAHFRKPFSNISRLTYLIPPRMTVAGLLAGILGMDRDSYYDIFSKDNFSMSVIPKYNLNTVRIPQNLVGTAKDEDMITFNNRGKGPKLNVLNPTRDRKQRVFEYVKNPNYNIFISLNDEDLEEEIYNRLKSKRYTYTPTLGLAKCLANIDSVEYVESSKIDSQNIELDSPCTDSSAITNVGNKNIVSEKITESFIMSEGSRGLPQRKSDSFVSYTFDKNCMSLDVNSNMYSKNNTVVRTQDDNIIEMY